MVFKSRDKAEWGHLGRKHHCHLGLKRNSIFFLLHRWFVFIHHQWHVLEGIYTLSLNEMCLNTNSPIKYCFLSCLHFIIIKNLTNIFSLVFIVTVSAPGKQIFIYHVSLKTCFLKFKARCLINSPLWGVQVKLWFWILLTRYLLARVGMMLFPYFCIKQKCCKSTHKTLEF